MRAGWGRAEITPPLGVELAGYGYYLERRAASVIDPLYARAIALEDEGETFIIICCDALGLSRAIVQPVLEQLLQNFRVASDHVMMVCIHTHTGPVLKYHEGCGAVDPAYTETVAPNIIKACAAALDDLTLVNNIDYSITKIDDDWAYNRANADGPVDRFVRSFRITRDDAQPIVIASYACHAVSRGILDGISADYPGEVCRLLDEQGVKSIFLNGLCGDIDPYPSVKAERQARLAPFARAVADACKRESGEAQSLPQRISGGRLSFELKLTPVSRESLQTAAEHSIQTNGEDSGAAKVARIWLGEMMEKYDSLTDADPVSAAWLRIGGVPIIALPFEGFTRTGELIREAIDDPRALTLGCAEEVMGYLPTIDDIKRRAYAALESAFLYKRLPPLPGEAERIGELLGEMMANNPK
jgi:hypothetical protein